MKDDNQYFPTEEGFDAWDTVKFSSGRNFIRTAAPAIPLDAKEEKLTAGVKPVSLWLHEVC